MPQKPEKTDVISMVCKGDFADRASPLIKRAHELEFAARWPTAGLRK
jgi:hypothetical protein